MRKSKVTGLPLAGDDVHAGTDYVATIKGGTIEHTNAATSRARGLAAVAHGTRRMAPTAHPAGPRASARGR